MERCSAAVAFVEPCAAAVKFGEPKHQRETDADTR
jgi:hypothetical protein